MSRPIVVQLTKLPTIVLPVKNFTSPHILIINPHCIPKDITLFDLCQRLCNSDEKQSMETQGG